VQTHLGGEGEDDFMIDDLLMDNNLSYILSGENKEASLHHFKLTKGISSLMKNLFLGSFWARMGRNSAT